jgi:hypothetical protein
MRRFWLLTLMLVALVAGVILPVAAQEADCPAGVHDAWRSTAIPIFYSFEEILNSKPNNIQAVAALQALRRQLDTAERPPCDDAAFEALHNALNLATDSIISNLLGNVGEATELLGMAIERLEEARVLLSVEPTPEPPAEDKVAAITFPLDNSTSPSPASVAGVYNRDLMDDEHFLWLFVIAPNARAYPQAVDGCIPNQRIPVPLSRFDNSWRMQVILGGDQDSGATFTFVLGYVGVETNEFLHKSFDVWCVPPQNFPGLTQAEIFDRSDVEILDVVNVIRE